MKEALSAVHLNFSCNKKRSSANVIVNRKRTMKTSILRTVAVSSVISLSSLLVSCDGGGDSATSEPSLTGVIKEKRVITFAGDSSGKLGIGLVGTRMIIDVNGNKVLEVSSSTSGPVQVDAEVGDSIDVKVVAGIGGGSVGDIYLASEGKQVQAKNLEFTKLSSAVSTENSGVSLIDANILVGESAAEPIDVAEYEEILSPMEMVYQAMELSPIVLPSNTFPASGEVRFEMSLIQFERRYTTCADKQRFLPTVASGGCGSNVDRKIGQ